ncbi:MAG: ATP-binding cassette domain-containing protein [Rhodothermales bacterium]
MKEIRLEHIRKTFGTLEVLKDVSLTVPAGSSGVVMGGSGSGKSVLIKHIVGLLKPDEGAVYVDGERVDDLDGDALDRVRLDTGYLFQSGAMFDSMTVFENMRFFLSRHRDMTEAEERDRVEELLTWVELPEKMNALPAELSGGQRKRVALARALVLDPSLMLYDEPTTGLDPISVRTVSELIVRLQEERNITSISITHDLLCAEIVADQVHFLDGGEIVAEGTLDDVRRSDHPFVSQFFASSTPPSP